MGKGVDGEWSDGASIGTWVDILTDTNETLRASLLSGRLSSVCLSVCLSRVGFLSVCLSVAVVSASGGRPSGERKP